jgi:hypothetical protein
VTRKSRKNWRTAENFGHYLTFIGACRGGKRAVRGLSFEDAWRRSEVDHRSWFVRAIGLVGRNAPSSVVGAATLLSANEIVLPPPSVARDTRRHLKDFRW